MSFLSLKFLVFLSCVVGIFFIIPPKYRKYWLLISSYYFYMNSDIRLLIYLLIITIFNYIGGILISKSNKNKKVYMLFWGADIASLIYFKYTEFFLHILCKLKLNMLINFEGGGELHLSEAFIPLGISFIIFQSTTYLGDIYKGKITLQEFSRCALFIAFFPTVLSGPINKAHELIPEFNFEKGVEKNRFLSGIFLILVGFFEKIFIADSLSLIVDPVFNNYLNYQGGHYIITAVAYSIQIYADFSAYSDIARGCAYLFGIYIKENFDRPYLSENISDFWKRWHMSLNAWLVEYVYIPLGGNREGTIRKYINTMVVFVISGLWHGANLTFVVWGVINGFFQIWGQFTAKPRKKLWNILGVNGNSMVKKWINRLTVFALITGTWIYFRASSLSEANYMIMQIWKGGVLQLFREDIWELFGTVKDGMALVLYLAFFIIISMWGKENEKILANYLEEPKTIKICILALCLMVLIVVLCGNYVHPDNAFIYFQF